MLDNTARPLMSSTRRSVLAQAAYGLAGAALASIPAKALDETGLPNLSLTIKSGRSVTVAKPLLRYYYGNNSYYYSTRSSYRSYTTKAGELCFAQGWIRVDYPIDKITEINRIDAKSLPKDSTQEPRKYPTLVGSDFRLESYGDIFEVVFTDGSRAMVNMRGTINGTAKTGSLTGVFSAKISELDHIKITAPGVAEFGLKSGATQAGVSHITATHDGPLDSITHHVVGSDLEISVETEVSGDKGGIMVTLPASRLGSKTISFTRKESADKNRKKSVFQIAGLGTAVVDGEIAWMRSDKETYRNSLVTLEGACTISGLACRVFVDLDQIQALTVSGEKDALRIKSLTVGATGNVGAFEISNISSVTLWYVDKASGYNDSSVKTSVNFKVGQLLTEVKMADVSALSTGQGGTTTLVLKNGESYEGSIQMEDGKPLAIVGQVANGYEGFAAVACFLLSDIASLKAVGS